MIVTVKAVIILGRYTALESLALYVQNPSCAYPNLEGRLSCEGSITDGSWCRQSYPLKMVLVLT